MGFKSFDIVYVRFVDHFRADDVYEDDVVDTISKPHVVEVVGFFLGESDTYIAIAVKRSVDSKNYLIYGIMKNAIIEIKKLRGDGNG